jgi:hypothetical protein
VNAYIEREREKEREREREKLIKRPENSLVLKIYSW